jgi:hypothetical protein
MSVRLLVQREAAAGLAPGRAEAVEQIRLAERLFQEGRRPGAEGAGADFLSRITRDKNDGDAPAVGREMTLKPKPPHARHLDVEDEARDTVQAIGAKEALGGSKNDGSKAKRGQQVRCGLPQGLVVVYNCDEWLSGHVDIPEQGYALRLR